MTSSGFIATRYTMPTLGERRRLPELAERATKLARSVRPDIAVACWQIAAVARIRLGERLAAIENWQRANDVAGQAGLRRACSGLGLTLASQNLDEGRVDEARRWLDSSRRLIDLSEDRSLTYACLMVETELALREDDVDTLRGLCERASAFVAEDVSPRIHRFRRAMIWLARHLSVKPSFMKTPYLTSPSRNVPDTKTATPETSRRQCF
jgi:hypothetical protein